MLLLRFNPKTKTLIPENTPKNAPKIVPRVATAIPPPLVLNPKKRKAVCDGEKKVEKVATKRVRTTNSKLWTVESKLTMDDDIQAPFKGGKGTIVNFGSKRGFKVEKMKYSFALPFGLKALGKCWGQEFELTIQDVEGKRFSISNVSTGETFSGKTLNAPLAKHRKIISSRRAALGLPEMGNRSASECFGFSHPDTIKAIYLNRIKRN